MEEEVDGCGRAGAVSKRIDGSPARGGGGKASLGRRSEDRESWRLRGVRARAGAGSKEQGEECDQKGGGWGRGAGGEEGDEVLRLAVVA
eukprot:300839-Hanusia_phi.AAC.1